MQPIIGLRPGQTAAVERGSAALPACSTRDARTSVCSPRSCRTPAARSRWCGRTRRSSRTSSAPHQRIVLFGKVELWGSRGCRSPIPSSRSSTVRPARPRAARAGPEGTAHRPDRARLRADRQRHDQHAAPLRVAGARAAAATMLFDPVPERNAARATTGPRAAPRSTQAHFSCSRHQRRRAECVRDRGPAAVDLRGLLRLPGRPRASPSRERASAQGAACATVDDDIRAAARAVLPFKLTAGQRDALAEIVADMQRALADAAAAAGRRRRRQDDRRGAGRGRRDGERLPGRVHGARPRSSPSSTTGRVMRWLDGDQVPRRACSPGASPPRQRRELLPAIAARRHRPRHRHARAGPGTRRVPRAGARRSSTSSIASAWCSAATLAAKGGNPDVLVMTATPIPRTLALTECGDMDVSVIRGLPPGRKPMTTLVKPDSRRDEVYALIREEVARGRQAYVVYPLVEESEKVDLAPRRRWRRSCTDVFPEFEVALLHGRMKGDEKDAVMRAFARRRAPHPRRHLGRRSRRRRAERHDDGGRARRALRPVAAAPAARPHRPRRARVDLRPGLPGAVVRRCARAAQGDGGDDATGSSSRRRTCRFAARATSSAPGSRACRSCAPAISPATPTCSSCAFTEARAPSGARDG